MKTRIAEWLLSLVLPPDRAAATAGDFAEDATNHGGAWFWTSVLRIVLSGVWNDMSERPAWLATLALGAWGLNLAWMLGFMIAFIILIIPTAIIYAMFTHAFGPLPPAGKMTLHGLTRLSGAGAVVFASWLTGRWLGRREPNKITAACTATCLIQFILTNGLALLIMTAWGSSLEHIPGPAVPSISSLEIFAINGVSMLALFAGAVRTRHIAQLAQQNIAS